ncbi:MAG TPA: DNA mismatch repair protein MutS [candidate division Zixibacteria bacterium]|nr:DNA mismatch repair protein MutS [candidate division Zixibacteria bacterium]
MTEKKQNKAKTTPLMAQYYSIKERVPDALLLFRMGDFFELFDEDAKIAAEVLGIALTQRSHGMPEPTPLAGVPHHSIEKYLSKLLAAGFKVAICEQVEDPKKAKGIVDRDIVEIMTPGTATIETGASAEASCIVSALEGDGTLAVATADLLGGRFDVRSMSIARFLDELQLLAPKEILVSEEISEELLDEIKSIAHNARISFQEPWKFEIDFARERLREHFGVKTLEGYGELSSSEISCAGGLIAYFKDLQKGEMAHIRSITIGTDDDAMTLDASTVRNLELVRSISEGKLEGTLLWVIDATCTPMGGRKIFSWILQPLIKRQSIDQRQVAVESLVADPMLLAKVRDLLSQVGDMERLIGKLGNEKANPRDLVALKIGLDRVPPIKQLLPTKHNPLLEEIDKALDPMDEMREIIAKNIAPEPPIQFGEGGVIAVGVSTELDELRTIRYGGKKYLAEMQERLREELGIPKLKIGYNRVFGYYIEVSRVNQDKVPAEFERKQTLVASERYITAELKEYEQKVLSAEERIFEIERELFLTIRAHLSKFAAPALLVADALARLDVLCSLAEIARRKGWIRPEFTDEPVIEIVEGRHPVVEQILGDRSFVPNDTRLASDDNQLLVITGPNMSGKSTYLRQVAQIVLLAQIGSFVPAQKCRLRPVDRIFTRVGAMDNIARGQSTFLVEMIETANILNNATDHSLVLLDEIGRGTSTYDGLSIAWAVSEFLHNAAGHRAMTIFATHYHELTELANIYPRVRNFQVAVREHKDAVQFLHKIVPGGCDDSYGIYVAKLAGVPESVIFRATDILSALESGEKLSSESIVRIGGKKGKTIRAEGVQISLFEPENHPLVHQLRDIDPERITPLEALEQIARWRKRWVRW